MRSDVVIFFSRVQLERDAVSMIHLLPNDLHQHLLPPASGQVPFADVEAIHQKTAIQPSHLILEGLSLFLSPIVSKKALDSAAPLDLMSLAHRARG